MPSISRRTSGSKTAPHGKFNNKQISDKLKKPMEAL
jgi:hypothetical protein